MNQVRQRITSKFNLMRKGEVRRKSADISHFSSDQREARDLFIQY